MNLYLLEQDENVGDDTFDSCVVVARTAHEAKLITPDGNDFGYKHSVWAPNKGYVTVTLIGIAMGTQKEGHVICSSFNAG